MAVFVQYSKKDLVIRTSLSAAAAAVRSSQSCLRSPDHDRIRPDFDMELSLEMRAAVGPK